MWDGQPFSGAKIALLNQGTLIAYKRDNLSCIPFPGMWDLPGGGREGSEPPVDCAIRETREEFGILVKKEAIVWGKRYPGVLPTSQASYFFVAHVSPREFDAVSFGDEGQYWKTMTIQEFINHREGIEHLQSRLRDFLSCRGLK